MSVYELDLRGQELTGWLPRPWVAYESQRLVEDHVTLGYKVLATRPDSDDILIGKGHTRHDAEIDLLEQAWDGSGMGPIGHVQYLVASDDRLRWFRPPDTLGHNIWLVDGKYRCLTCRTNWSGS